MSPEKKNNSQRLLRVDNWAGFLVQRLQLMFAKGDSCDLTLKFNNNQELKVHRLILTTCTKYFDQVSDNEFTMPDALSYNSMLPIVNFMYSGRLEFKPEIQENVLTTAKALNMSILVQLLMAHKAKLTGEKLNIVKKEDVKKHRSSIQSTPKSTLEYLGEKKLPFWKKRAFPLITKYPELKLKKEEEPMPTRFEWPCEDTTSLLLTSPSFSSVSYESEPVMVSPAGETRLNNSESVSHTPVKRRVAPPQGPLAKSPRLVESRIVGDDDEDDHFENLHSYEDSDDEAPADQPDEFRELTPSQAPQQLLASLPDIQTTPKPILKPSSETTPGPSSKKVRFRLSEDKENNAESTPSITVPPTIKVESKETEEKEVPNHAKIIAEVLKKFPDLVKGNKNIKVKITTPASSPSDGKTTLPKSSYVVVKPADPKEGKKIEKVDKSEKEVSKDKLKEKPKEPQLVDAVVTNVGNISGTWTCDKCTIDNQQLCFDSFVLFKKHLHNVHSEKVDSRICEFCGYRATKRNLMLFHHYTKHNIQPPKNSKFPKCPQCSYVALNDALLLKHTASAHQKRELVCSICKLSFKTSSSFQAHCVTCKPSNEVRSYVCEKCGKQFRTNVSLKAHFKDCTGIKEEIETQSVELIEVPMVEQGEKGLMPLPQGIIMDQGVILQEANGLTTLPSVSFNVLSEEHQTVILLDENSDFFLQGGDSVVVGEEQEYVVPDVLPTRLYTAGDISYVNATSVITYPVMQVQEQDLSSQLYVTEKPVEKQPEDMVIDSTIQPIGPETTMVIHEEVEEVKKLSESDRAKQLTTDWDFDNEEEEGDGAEDPDSRPSRPSIELEIG